LCFPGVLALPVEAVFTHFSAFFGVVQRHNVKSLMLLAFESSRGERSEHIWAEVEPCSVQLTVTSCTCAQPHCCCS
jgi:hypothetical protein